MEQLQVALTGCLFAIIAATEDPLAEPKVPPIARAKTKLRGDYALLGKSSKMMRNLAANGTRS